MLKIQICQLPGMDNIQDNVYLFDDLEMYVETPDGWEKLRKNLTQTRHTNIGMYNWNLPMTIPYGKTSKYRRVWCHTIYGLIFVPNPQNYKRIEYIDGNRLNCTIENLRWVDQSSLAKENSKRRWQREKLEGKKHGEVRDKRRKNFNPSKHSQTF